MMIKCSTRVFVALAVVLVVCGSGGVRAEKILGDDVEDIMMDAGQPAADVPNPQVGTFPQSVPMAVAPVAPVPNVNLQPAYVPQQVMQMQVMQQRPPVQQMMARAPAPAPAPAAHAQPAHHRFQGGAHAMPKNNHIATPPDVPKLEIDGMSLNGDANAAPPLSPEERKEQEEERREKKSHRGEVKDTLENMKPDDKFRFRQRYYTANDLHGHLITPSMHPATATHHLTTTTGLYHHPSNGNHAHLNMVYSGLNANTLHVPDVPVNDPCIPLCDFHGGWKTPQCQECVFRGLVNGYIVHHERTMKAGHNFIGAAAAHCKRNEMIALHNGHRRTTFATCVFDTLHAKCNGHPHH